MRVIQEHALTVGFNDPVTLETKHILRESIALHHVVHIRKPMLDAIKDELKKYNVGKFLNSRPYLQNEAFPRIEEHIYTKERLLRHVDYIGSGKERIRLLFDTYFESLGK